MLKKCFLILIVCIVFMPNISYAPQQTKEQKRNFLMPGAIVGVALVLIGVSTTLNPMDQVFSNYGNNINDHRKCNPGNNNNGYCLVRNTR